MMLLLTRTLDDNMSTHDLRSDKAMLHPLVLYDVGLLVYHQNVYKQAQGELRQPEM